MHTPSVGSVYIKSVVAHVVTELHIPAQLLWTLLAIAS